MDDIVEQYGNLEDVEDEDVENVEECLDIENVTEDEQIVPKVGMGFDSIDELYDFYKKNMQRIWDFP